MFLCVFCARLFLRLTPSPWLPAWRTSWQTRTCRICCPAGPSRPDLLRETGRGKPSEIQRLPVKNNLTGQSDRERVPAYLNRLIYLVRRRGGCHGNGDGRRHGELSRSSPRLCLAVQGQRQEAGGSDGMHAVGRKRAGAANHGAELPTWHTDTHMSHRSQHTDTSPSALCL